MDIGLTNIRAKLDPFSEFRNFTNPLICLDDKYVKLHLSLGYNFSAIFLTAMDHLSLITNE